MHAVVSGLDARECKIEGKCRRWRTVFEQYNWAIFVLFCACSNMCQYSTNGHCTASQYSDTSKHSTSLLQTNQKFHHKFPVFECMKTAQNYAQVSLPLSHTI